jgi:hypothetical protein
MSPPKAQPKSVPDKVVVRRALISVSDKTGLVERAKKLAAAGVDLEGLRHELQEQHDPGHISPIPPALDVG